MKIILETNRLYFREFRIEDAPYMYQLNIDPEVMRYTGDNPFKNEAEAQVFLTDYIQNVYPMYGFGRWAVILKESQEWVGWCGLKKNEQNQIDIGFRFMRKHWGNGYATEAAQACIQYAFNQLGLIQVVGRAARANPASIRVLSKLGMEYWKDAPCMGIEDAIYYRISALQ
ncbi:MAG: GNAT family N-acetyltransferase [Saprospiraceae bacterium]|nr:GNAT family N-acetyltransferase [Saprospiraceae bacterium]